MNLGLGAVPISLRISGLSGASLQLRFVFLFMSILFLCTIDNQHLLFSVGYSQQDFTVTGGVTYPVANDSEWQVTQEWRSIKVFSDDPLYINRVFLLLSFSPLYHRIYTRSSPKYYSNRWSGGWQE